MFGFEGTGVLLAYILTILSAILCVVYGMMNWNKSGENEGKEVAEEVKWEKKDSKVKNKL